jgi:hypothetical protein
MRYEYMYTCIRKCVYDDNDYYIINTVYTYNCTTDGMCLQVQLRPNGRPTENYLSES